MKKIMRRKEEEGMDILVPVKNLVLAYIVTAVILMVLAFLVYKLRLPEKTVSICIIATYAAATFLAGFLTGKKMKKMKFVWGLLVGLAYFVILVIMSLIGGRAATMFNRDFVTTLLLCAGGGMLGGMVS